MLSALLSPERYLVVTSPLHPYQLRPQYNSYTCNLAIMVCYCKTFSFLQFGKTVQIGNQKYQAYLSLNGKTMYLFCSVSVCLQLSWMTIPALCVLRSTGTDKAAQKIRWGLAYTACKYIGVQFMSMFASFSFVTAISAYTTRAWRRVGFIILLFTVPLLPLHGL